VDKEFRVRYSAVGAAPWVAVRTDNGEWLEISPAEVPAQLKDPETDLASYAEGGDFVVLLTRVDAALNAAAAWLSGLHVADHLSNSKPVVTAPSLDNRLAVSAAWLCDPLSDYSEPDRYSSFGGIDAIIVAGDGRYGTDSGRAFSTEPPAGNKSAHIVFLAHKAASQFCGPYVMLCPSSKPSILDLNYLPVQDSNTEFCEVHARSGQLAEQLQIPPVPTVRSKFSGSANDVWHSADIFVRHLRDTLKVHATSAGQAEAETTQDEVIELIQEGFSTMIGQATTFSAVETSTRPSATQSVLENNSALPIIVPIDPLMKKSGLQLHMGTMSAILIPIGSEEKIPIFSWRAVNVGIQGVGQAQITKVLRGHGWPV
jgi:hypothetical protein